MQRRLHGGGVIGASTLYPSTSCAGSPPHRCAIGRKNKGGGMRHFAVVGSGPAGFYTAEALEKAYGDQARIDILDRYPVPYGLIRFGVAPDHQSLKAVSKRYDKVAESGGVDFIGNVSVGRDVSVDELLDLYDAVILATGAPHDRKLGIPGEDLPGVRSEEHTSELQSHDNLVCR